MPKLQSIIYIFVFWIEMATVERTPAPLVFIPSAMLQTISNIAQTHGIAMNYSLCEGLLAFL